MRRLWIIACFLLLVSCGNSPKLLWKFKTEGRIYGAPVVFKQLVIAASADSFLYALDLTTGKEVWKKSFDAPFFSSPMIDDNVLYIGTGKGDLVSMNPSNGNVMWSVPTRDVIEYVPCTDEVGIYFGNNRGMFYKIGKDGKPLWQTSLGDKVSGFCGVQANLVYTSSWDKNFYALDRSTGNVVWKQPSGTLNFNGPLFQNQRVWFASHEHLFCFDALTGSLQFTRETTYSNSIVPWMGLMWTSEKRKICKRDTDGNLLQAIDFNSGPLTPIPLTHVLVVSDSKDALVALSPELKVVWKFRGDEAFTGGELDAGNLYAGNLDGNLYALRLPE